MDLKSHREEWAERKRLEDEIEIPYLRSLTIPERLALFQVLYEAAVPFLAKSNTIIDREREDYWIEFQARLQRLAFWQKEHRDRTIHQRSTAAKPFC